jgi:protoporphyrinogen/coproporphyrinogen III oxidase
VTYAVIVGSGLAGLAAAFRLEEQGWSVTVLESSDRVGGRVLSEARDGFLLDVGQKEAGAELLQATEYTGCYSLQLLYDRRPHQEPFIIMVPKAASAEVCAVFLEHVKAPDRAPAGHSQFTTFFNLNSEIDFAGWSDARLTEAARSFVESLFPELAGHCSASHLTRWTYAAHKGNVGHYRALVSFLERYPADDPVQVAGDYMSVAGQESAVVAGVKAARRLLDRLP